MDRYRSPTGGSVLGTKNTCFLLNSSLSGFHLGTCLPERLAYFGSRGDAKARVQTNFFDRWYQRKFICELCMSPNPPLWFLNYKPDCPWYMTYLSDATYRLTSTTVSPWTAMPGRSLRSCFWDWMHCVYLGIAKDLISNLLADFNDVGALGEGTLDETETILPKYAEGVQETKESKLSRCNFDFSLYSITNFWTPKPTGYWDHPDDPSFTASVATEGLLFENCTSPRPTLGWRTTITRSLALLGKPRM